ncbi:MAG: hypothetical protein IJ849_09405 [Selenomonadaceae bacterium]|nr:hypothetical protein [Selenomonadaceae bacterium]
MKKHNGTRALAVAVSLWLMSGGVGHAGQDTTVDTDLGQKSAYGNHVVSDISEASTEITENYTTGNTVTLTTGGNIYYSSETGQGLFGFYFKSPTTDFSASGNKVFVNGGTISSPSPGFSLAGAYILNYINDENNPTNTVTTNSVTISGGTA